MFQEEIQQKTGKKSKKSKKILKKPKKFRQKSKKKILKKSKSFRKKSERDKKILPSPQKFVPAHKFHASWDWKKYWAMTRRLKEMQMLSKYLYAYLIFCR